MKRNNLAYQNQCCPNGLIAKVMYRGRRKGEPTWKFCMRSNAYGKGRPGMNFTKTELLLGKHWGKIPKVINSQPFVYDGLTNVPSNYGGFCAMNKDAPCYMRGH